MRNFCLLTSMELILTPNCSLLYLHSNDINSLKSFTLKKKLLQKPQMSEYKRLERLIKEAIREEGD